MAKRELQLGGKHIIINEAERIAAADSHVRTGVAISPLYHASPRREIPRHWRNGCNIFSHRDIAVLTIRIFSRSDILMFIRLTFLAYRPPRDSLNHRTSYLQLNLFLDISRSFFTNFLDFLLVSYINTIFV